MTYDNRNVITAYLALSELRFFLDRAGMEQGCRHLRGALGEMQRSLTDSDYAFIRSANERLVSDPDKPLEHRLAKILGVFHHDSEQSSLKTLERLLEQVQVDTQMALDRAGVTLGRSPGLIDVFSYPEDSA